MQNTCCLACGFEFYSTVASFKCPKCKSQIGRDRLLPPGHEQSKKRNSQRNHWLPLHEYGPQNRESWNKREAIGFFNRWKQGIPKFGCKCSEEFDELLHTLPPVFRSAKCFAERAWQWHDAVSKKIGNTQITWKDCLASWWGEINPSRPNLLITVATGPSLAHWGIVRPSFEAYADKIGADLVAIVNVSESWWGYEKFRVQPFVRQYERTIFADSDLVFSKNCENLLDLVPSDKVGIHDDWPELPCHDWMVGERDDVCRSQNWKVEDKGVCLNSGIVVCSRGHTVWQRPEFDLPTQHHCSEQFYVEQKILRENTPWVRLPTKFNTQWWMPRYRQLLPEASVNHLANSRNKGEDLQRAMKEFGYE